MPRQAGRPPGEPQSCWEIVLLAFAFFCSRFRCGFTAESSSRKLGFGIHPAPTVASAGWHVAQVLTKCAVHHVWVWRDLLLFIFHRLRRSIRVREFWKIVCDIENLEHGARRQRGADLLHRVAASRGSTTSRRGRLFEAATSSASRLIRRNVPLLAQTACHADPHDAGVEPQAEYCRQRALHLPLRARPNSFPTRESSICDAAAQFRRCES